MPVATAFLAILKGFGSFLLLLAGLTAFATVVQNLKSRSNRRKKLHSVKSVEDEEERLKRHEDGKREAREKADVEHMRKANDYVDRKLKPRQEELRQRKLAEADRFSDPAWKDPGHKLGTTKEDTNSGTSPTEPTIKDESELVAEGARRVQDALRAFSDVDDLGLDDEALTFAPAKLVTPAIPSSDEEFEMLEAACLDESSQRPEQADHRVAADRAPSPSGADAHSAADAHDGERPACATTTTTSKQTRVPRPASRARSGEYEKEGGRCSPAGSADPPGGGSAASVESRDASQPRPPRSGLPVKIGAASRIGLPASTSPQGSMLPVMSPKSPGSATPVRSLVSPMPAKVPGSAPAEKSPVSPTPAKIPGSAPAEKSPVSPTPAKIPGSAPAEKSPVSPTPAKIPGSAPAEKSLVSPTPAKIPGSAPAEKSPVSPTPAKIPGSAPAEKSPVSPTPAKIPGSAPAEKSHVSPTPAKIPGSAPAEKSPVSPTPAKIPGSAPAEKSPVSPTPAKIPGSAPAEKSPVSPTPAKIPGSAPAEKSPVSPTPAKIPGSAPAEKSPGTDFADKPKTRLPQLKVKVPKTIEEPVAGTPDIVPVNIKTAHGKTFKRNFLQSDKIQDILDYMQMEGYHQMAFTLCTPFPRRDLSDKATQTLKEAGFTSSVLLVMEERDEI